MIYIQKTGVQLILNLMTEKKRLKFKFIHVRYAVINCTMHSLFCRNKVLHT